MTEALQTTNSQSQTMSVKQVSDRVNIVHKILKTVMKEGTHYGKVPGCGNKMVLFKPGADVLAMTFRLVPEFDYETIDMGGGHREYRVKCTMRSAEGFVLGQGVGSCCTMEKKYRYVNQVEREDIADVYNTVLKMAKKRAHIDATLTVTGAADIFTQDMIDADDEDENKKPVGMPKPKATQSVQSAEQVTIIGQVVNLAEKTGAKNNKTFVRYGIQIDEGNGGDAVWTNTFDSTLNDIAKACKTSNLKVEAVYTEGRYGKDLVSIAEHVIDQAE